METPPAAPGPPQAPPPAPRWVKLLALGLLLLVVAGVLLALLSGGQHGPGRHRSLGGVGTVTVAPAVVA